MKPADIRDMKWQELQELLTAARLKVYEAYQAHGPCTTLQLCAHMSPRRSARIGPVRG